MNGSCEGSGPVRRAPVRCDGVLQLLGMIASSLRWTTVIACCALGIGGGCGLLELQERRLAARVRASVAVGEPITDVVKKAEDAIRAQGVYVTPG